jgi:hypothetical protein
VASDQLSLGLYRAEVGTKSVISHNFDYAARASEFVERLPTGALLDAELLRKAIGDPPHPNLIGAIFRTLAKRKLIVKSGYRMSSRPSRHAAEIRCYTRA